MPSVLKDSGCETSTPFRAPRVASVEREAGGSRPTRPAAQSPRRAPRVASVEREAVLTPRVRLPGAEQYPGPSPPTGRNLPLRGSRVASCGGRRLRCKRRAAPYGSSAHPRGSRVASCGGGRLRRQPKAAPYGSSAHPRGSRVASCGRWAGVARHPNVGPHRGLGVPPSIVEVGGAWQSQGLRSRPSGRLANPESRGRGGIALGSQGEVRVRAPCNESWEGRRSTVGAYAHG
ncbi:hypothetical protein GGX14DRAFT_405417 [Mycena pura]|uniref:Uncharacterized protein n=1 Tax=Mycena pura TaxID=153505 RepID=A0AAD6USA8_9AGAR|nr:hypothetical protein GGX14DRAFT_405417 [Mycena pura]